MSLIDLSTLVVIALAAQLAAHTAQRDLAAPFKLGALAIAAAIGALGAALSLTGVDWRSAYAFAALVIVCALIAEIDRRAWLIPDPLVLALLALALVTPFGVPWAEALAGAALLGAFFFCVRWAFAQAARDDALGLGDVKLAAAIGALVGPQLGLIATVLAGIATLSVAAPAALRANDSALRAGAPFGIGLAAALVATAAARLWGGP